MVGNITGMLRFISEKTVKELYKGLGVVALCCESFPDIFKKSLKKSVIFLNLLEA